MNDHEESSGEHCYVKFDERLDTAHICIKPRHIPIYIYFLQMKFILQSDITATRYFAFWYDFVSIGNMKWIYVVRLCNVSGICTILLQKQLRE